MAYWALFLNFRARVGSAGETSDTRNLADWVPTNFIFIISACNMVAGTAVSSIESPVLHIKTETFNRKNYCIKYCVYYVHYQQSATAFWIILVLIPTLRDI